MSDELLHKVLCNAPASLTPAERIVLLVLAEEAEDGSREIIGFPTGTLCRRTGLMPSDLHKVLVSLKQRGFDIRVPLGQDRSGAPVYAIVGRQRIYRIPEFAPMPAR